MLLNINERLLRKKKLKIARELDVRRSIIEENDCSFEGRVSSPDDSNLSLKCIREMLCEIAPFQINKGHVYKTRDKLINAISERVHCSNIDLISLADLSKSKDDISLFGLWRHEKHIVVTSMNLNCWVNIETCPISSSRMYTVSIKDCENKIIKIGYDSLYFCRIWNTDDLIHLLNNPINYLRYVVESIKVEDNKDYSDDLNKILNKKSKSHLRIIK